MATEHCWGVPDQCAGGRGVIDIGIGSVRLPGLAHRETDVRSIAGPGIFLLEIQGILAAIAFHGYQIW